MNLNKYQDSIHRKRQRKLAWLKMNIKNILSHSEFLAINELRATFNEHYFVDVLLAKLEIELLILEKHRDKIVEDISSIASECHYMCQDDTYRSKIMKDMYKHIKNDTKI
jgi:hypothetical protein